MADTGFVLATAGASVTGTGDIAWTNPSRVTADDASNATASLGKSEDAERIRATFADLIPAGSQVNGIQIRIQCLAPAGATITLVSAIVGKANATLGSDLGGFDVLTATPTDYTFGGATELWGLSWTATEVNADTFQALFQIVNTSGIGTGSAAIDAIWVKIFYTPPVGNRFFIIG